MLVGRRARSAQEATRITKFDRGGPKGSLAEMMEKAVHAPSDGPGSQVQLLFWFRGMVLWNCRD